MAKKFEIAEILEILSKYGVRFIVAGGVAVGLHGFVRATKDIDLVMDFSRDNIERFAAALSKIGFIPKVPIKVSDLADSRKRELWIKEKNAVVMSFYNPSDLFFQIDIFLGKDFDCVTSVEKALRNLKIKVVSLDELIKMKKAAGRPTDIIDIKQLEKIKEQE